MGPDLVGVESLTQLFTGISDLLNLSADLLEPAAFVKRGQLLLTTPADTAARPVFVNHLAGKAQAQISLPDSPIQLRGSEHGLLARALVGHLGQLLDDPIQF